MANGSMYEVAGVGQGSRPPSSCNWGGDHLPNILMEGFQTSAKNPKPVVDLRKFFSKPILVLMLALVCATTCIGLTSAQTNVSIATTAHNCSSNLICLGSAHVYNGSSSDDILDGMLSLIPEGSYIDSIQQVGIAYSSSPIQFVNFSSRQSASFKTSFTIKQVYGVYNGSSIVGDGMTFIISASNQSVGASGAYFGIFYGNGVTTFKSIVIEFDTYQNTDSPAFDISASHVSFDFQNITTPAAANTSDVNVNLRGTNPTYVWVEYTSETKLLEARVSYNNSRPTSSLLNYTVDFLDVSEEYMWVGFSASSGNSYSNFYIGDWTFESYGLDAPSPSVNPILKVGESGRKKVGVIVGTSVGVVSAVLLAALFVWRRSRGGSTGSADAMIQIEGMPERFSYKQLSVATRAFSEDAKLGQGGFGSVYRGVLPSSGTLVAVKKINGNSSQGEKEFLAEVSIISQLRHRNLIQLQGWCKDTSRGSKYLLVYELMPNESLDKALFGSETDCLSWPQRLNIVRGTAAALEYLHQGWHQQIIHRDIKPSNIMLDANWNAKLGDFGLARLVDHQQPAATTLMAGTYGYIAPEVAAFGRFTDKTDVFAFGAVLLEVACGRKVLSDNLPDNQMSLVDWVWRRLSEDDLMSTVDMRLGSEYDPHWMEAVLTIGLLCSHPHPLERPLMRHVVQVLNGDVPVPSIPACKPAPVGSQRVRSSMSEGSSTSRSSSIALVCLGKGDSCKDDASDGDSSQLFVSQSSGYHLVD